jgi:hypothetical protein
VESEAPSEVPEPQVLEDVEALSMEELLMQVPVEARDEG